jgi:hypothetical protein
LRSSSEVVAFDVSQGFVEERYIYLGRLLECARIIRGNVFRRALRRYRVLVTEAFPNFDGKDRETVLWVCSHALWQRPQLAHICTTVLARAQAAGALLSAGQMMWAGRRAATAFRARHGHDPGRLEETGPDGQTRAVFAYTVGDLDLVDVAILAEVNGEPRTGLGGGRRRTRTAPGGPLVS